MLFRSGVEVDVRMIGKMAKNTADVNGDGKLDVGDVKYAAARVGTAVAHTASKVEHAVANAASNVGHAAASAVSSAASTVRSWLPW